MHSLTQMAPEVVRHKHVLLGTIEKKVWQEGIRGSEKPHAEMLQHVAEFKNLYELEYEPGGWYPRL